MGKSCIFLFVAYRNVVCCVVGIIGEEILI
jgi:hypothetical protein